MTTCSTRTVTSGACGLLQLTSRIKSHFITSSPPLVEPISLLRVPTRQSWASISKRYSCCPGGPLLESLGHIHLEVCRSLASSVNAKKWFLRGESADAKTLGI